MCSISSSFQLLFPLQWRKPKAKPNLCVQFHRNPRINFISWRIVSSSSSSCSAKDNDSLQIEYEAPPLELTRLEDDIHSRSSLEFQEDDEVDNLDTKGSRFPEIQKLMSESKDDTDPNKIRKFFFANPENRSKIRVKGYIYHCGNCGKPGHRRYYCPDLKGTDRRYKCSICGQKGHTRRYCPQQSSGEKCQNQCHVCGEKGHNRRTCPRAILLPPSGDSKEIMISSTDEN